MLVLVLVTQLRNPWDGEVLSRSFWRNTCTEGACWYTSKLALALAASVGQKVELRRGEAMKSSLLSPGSLCRRPPRCSQELAALIQVTHVNPGWSVGLLVPPGLPEPHGHPGTALRFLTREQLCEEGKEVCSSRLYDPKWPWLAV